MTCFLESFLTLSWKFIGIGSYLEAAGFLGNTISNQLPQNELKKLKLMGTQTLGSYTIVSSAYFSGKTVLSF